LVEIVPHHILNFVLVAGLLISYIFLVHSKKSPFRELVQEFFEEKRWSKDIKYIRDNVRQLATISAIMAGIALTTVAFVTSRIEISKEDLLVPGIVMILMSSVLFFWSLGLNFNASMPNTNSARSAKFFETGYYLISFGVYLFFSGLIWSLNFLNPWYTTFSIIMYVVIFLIVWKTLRRSNKFNQTP